MNDCEGDCKVLFNLIDAIKSLKVTKGNEDKDFLNYLKVSKEVNFRVRRSEVTNGGHRPCRIII